MKVGEKVKVVVVKHDIDWQKAGAGLVFGALLQIAYIAIAGIVLSKVVAWLGFEGIWEWL